MSEDGEEFSSVDDVMKAVNLLVARAKTDKGYLTGFKMHVYMGRGCHEFVLNDAVGKAADDVSDLEKRLALAKDNLNKQLEIQKKRKQK